MSDAEQARQDDQIEKLWKAIDAMRKEEAEQWSVMREMRAVLVGVDGMNGMNSRIRSIETIVKGLESNQEILRRYVDTQLANHPLTCPVGKMVEQHIQDGKEIYVTKRADWQKWVQTIAMVIAAASLIITVVLK